VTDDLPKPEKLSQIDLTMPSTGWMDTPALLKKGIFCHAARAKDIEALNMPNPRDWRVEDDDWKLPENWQEIILDGLRERLENFVPSGSLWIPAFVAGPARTSVYFFYRVG